MLRNRHGKNGTRRHEWQVPAGVAWPYPLDLAPGSVLCLRKLKQASALQSSQIRDEEVTEDGKATGQGFAPKGRICRKSGDSCRRHSEGLVEYRC